MRRIRIIFEEEPTLDVLDEIFDALLMKGGFRFVPPVIIPGMVLVDDDYGGKYDLRKVMVMEADTAQTGRRRYGVARCEVHLYADAGLDGFELEKTLRRTIRFSKLLSGKYSYGGSISV